MNTKTLIVTVFAACLTLLLAVGASAGGKNERAVTNWLVMFNDTSQCMTEPCGEDDLFAEGNPAKSTICFGTGQTVQANGRATFAGRFAEGTNFGCFAPGPGPVYGLMDADTTEIHIVAQEHGAARETGMGLEEQVAYFLGACNPDCVDTQFAIHVAGGGPMVNVYRFGDGSLIRGATSTLSREGDGIRFVLHTRFER